MRRLLIALIGWSLLAVGAAAEERITNFVSEVTINLDGSLDVVESIAVMVEGKEIKRGILRDFPISHADRNGRKVDVDFEVLSVQRDGRDEPNAIEAVSNGKRIRIGDKDVFLEHGPHTYRIAYRTSRQLGFFETYDELYWNVTGHGWSFAIDRAEVIVALPPGAMIIQHAAYTGRQGEAGQDYRVTRREDSAYHAVTTRRLAPGEGFTVAVGFTKGFVTPPIDTHAAANLDGRHGLSVFHYVLAVLVFVMFNLLL
jgi:hypothetical protein